MKTLVRTVVFVSLFSMPIRAEAGDKQANDRLSKVDRLFAEWNRKDVPGCAVGILQDGKLTYAKGFGTANLNYGIPNTTTTVFETGSMTKKDVPVESGRADDIPAERIPNRSQRVCLPACHSECTVFAHVAMEVWRIEVRAAGIGNADEERTDCVCRRVFQ